MPRTSSQTSPAASLRSVQHGACRRAPAWERATAAGFCGRRGA